MGDVEMADAESQDFKISAVISGHTSDVKIVQCTPEGTIISGSRDDTARLWTKRAGEFNETMKFEQPKGMCVNSLAFYDSGDEFGWRVYVGRRDGTIAVFRSGSADPVITLKHHNSNVCVLAVDSANERLLSGSWDNNVIIWPIKQMENPDGCPALLLNGHTMSVWAVASFPGNPGYYLSGSADQKIKMWHDDTEVATFLGHTDVVRSLVVLGNSRFLSAANDATIRLWNVESATNLATFNSTVDAYIYSMSLFDDYVLTCGEGGHVEVWRRGDVGGEVSLSHQQTLHTAATTAWSVCALPNGDIAAGSSDNRVYVWSGNGKRQAPAGVQESVAAEVAAKVAAQLERIEKQSSETVVIKVSLDDGAPNMELRYKKGTDPTKAAETFITENNLPISYLNEITEYIAANIPEARAALSAKYRPQETQRSTVDGEKYDYAFEVTTDDGRKLTLGYNAGECVDAAAQRFVEKHNLPIKFLQQVATLLRAQTGGGAATNATTGGGGGEFYDPFTGSGRYVPGGSSAGGSEAFADPLTGGGRYVPGASSGGAVDTTGDPYTQSGRYVPGTATDMVPNSCVPQDKQRPRGEFVPLSSWCVFGVEQISAKAIVKLKETNDKQSGLRLTDQQLSSLEQLMSSQPGAMQVDDVLLSALETGLGWSMDDIVPMLDLFRMGLLHQHVNRHYCDMKTRGSETRQRLLALIISAASDSVKVLACRCVANAFSHEWGRDMLAGEMGETVPVVAACLLGHKPIMQIAAASALANWSMLMLKRSESGVSELGPREDLVRVLIKLLENELSFGGRSEAALIKTLQAFVTAMWGDAAVIRLAKSRNVVAIVNRLKDACVEETGKNIARDIVEMTFAV